MKDSLFKKRIVFLIVVVFLISIINVTSVKDKDKDKGPHIDPDIEKELRKNPEAFVIVTLKEPDDDILTKEEKGKFRIKDDNFTKLKRQKSQDKVISKLGKHEFKESKRHNELINAFSGKVKKSALKKLEKDRDVDGVYLNKVVAYSMLDESIPVIEADIAHNTFLPPVGTTTGTGETICVIDSGIDSNHPDLRNERMVTDSYNIDHLRQEGFKVLLEKCYCIGTFGASNCCYNPTSGTYNLLESEGPGSSRSPFDGHGTHVAGIAAAKKNPSNTYGVTGVAPDANIIMVKAQDDNFYLRDPNDPGITARGAYSTADLLSAVGFCASKNPTVISMSIGSGVYGPSEACGPSSTIPVSNAIINAINRGIPVVAASGNGEYSNGISWPACIPEVISVASTKHGKYRALGGGELPKISDFSNIEESMVDIAAPGDTVHRSSWQRQARYLIDPLDNYDIYSTWPTYLDNLPMPYKVLRGTSMAAPHVSGAIALLQQYAGSKNIRLTPSQINSALRSSSILATYRPPILFAFGYFSTTQPPPITFPFLQVEDSGRWVNALTDTVSSRTDRLTGQSNQLAIPAPTPIPLPPPVPPPEPGEFTIDARAVTCTTARVRFVTRLAEGPNYGYHLYKNTDTSNTQWNYYASMTGVDELDVTGLTPASLNSFFVRAEYGPPLYADATKDSNKIYVQLPACDSKAPDLIIVEPKNRTYNSTEYLGLNFTVHDDTVLDRTWYRIDNGSNISVAGNETLNIFALAVSALNLTEIGMPESLDYINSTGRTLHLWAKDIYGNMNYTNVTFARNIFEIRVNTPPVIYTNTGDIKFNVTVNLATSQYSIKNVTLYGDWTTDFGTGTDGNLTVTVLNTVVNNYTVLTGNVSAGAKTFTIANPNLISNESEVLIVQMQNGLTGKYEFVKNVSINGNNITFDAGLLNDYQSGGFSAENPLITEVIRVPNYVNVTINSGASVTATAWNGTIGGIVVFRAKGTVIVNGAIDTTGRGFAGGSGGNGGAAVLASVPGNSGTQGSVGFGVGKGGGGNVGGNPGTDGNGGGGGGSGGSGGGGAGGSYSVLANAGNNGVAGAGGNGAGESNGGSGGSGAGGAAGSTYGTSDLSTIFLGSGGGGGAGGHSGGGGANQNSGAGGNGGNGGSGGGIIYITATTIINNGNIISNGGTSSNGFNGNDAPDSSAASCQGGGGGAGGSGGGGGSGGSIYLKAGALTQGNIASNGGSGSSGGNGGAGGDCTFNGPNPERGGGGGAGVIGGAAGTGPDGNGQPGANAAPGTGGGGGAGIIVTDIDSNSSGLANTNYIFRKNLSSLNDGVYYWYIQVCDTFGYCRNTGTGAIVLDKTKPVVNLLTNNNSWTTYFFSYEADDLTPVTCYLYGDFNGTYALNRSTNQNLTNDSIAPNWISIGGSNYFSIPGIKDNNTGYLWSVMCNDSLGNYAFNSTNFTAKVDNIVPLINFTTGTTTNKSLAQKSIFANVSASDLNLANISIRLDNSSGYFTSINLNSSGSYNFTNLNDDIYDLYATANDYAGNTNTTEIRTIILDNEYPIVNLVSPANNTGYSEFNPVYTYNVSDVLIDNCTLAMNSTLNQTFNNTDVYKNQYIYISNLTKGKYYWNVSCTDTLNRINTSLTFLTKLGYLPPAIPAVNEIYRNGKERIFELVIQNNATKFMENISWTFDTGDNVIINSTLLVTLNYSDLVAIYIPFTYSDYRNYTITAKASYNADPDDVLNVTYTTTSDVRTFNISNLKILNQNFSNVIFEFNVINSNGDNQSASNWSFSSEGVSINSSIPVILNRSESIMVFEQYNYTSYGSFTVTVSGIPEQYTKPASITIDNRKLELVLQSLSTNNLTNIIEFTIKNKFNVNISDVSWVYKPDSNMINSNSNSNLIPNETVLVYVQYTYNNSGAYNINASTRSVLESAHDSMIKTITI